MQHDARGAELRQLGSGGEKRLVLLAPVDEAAVELASRLADRIGGNAEVVDVVQWIVQAEDVDTARGSREDEAPHELVGHRTRPDEEAPAHRERKRRLHPRLEAADALPGAFDAPAHAGVEDAAAGDLEVGEPRAVEDLGQP